MRLGSQPPADAPFTQAELTMGVLDALMQHDLKRLLAYHTVENIGIIFIGLGLALAFQANGMQAAAALALTAALFHVFNHSVFKSLLFFGAGAVLTATGERDMEHLDENNPKHMAYMMRKMKDLMPPGSVPKELDVAIKRLESGEDPEKIEADMGDLLGDLMGGEEGGMGGNSGYTKDSGLYDY